MRISKLSVIGIVIVVLFICILAYIYVFKISSTYSLINNTTEHNSISITSTTTNSDQNLIKNIRVPEGWVVYQNEKLGIAFMYPQNWKVTENVRGGYTTGVSLTGDGYSIGILNYGSDVPQKEWTHPQYYIGGYSIPKTWEFFNGKYYTQILSMYPTLGDKFVVIWVNTPSDSKEISDRILSSIVFLK